MIQSDEIEAKAAELDIHVANVERDYVFGWLLRAISLNECLTQQLVFKGGNCMRKAFYPATRFSSDLDFSVRGAVDTERMKAAFNEACNFAEEASGIRFVTERTSFEADEMIDDQRRAYKGRIYFRDFYGNEEKIIISVRVDITEFDRLYLPTVTRSLIHPYSDAEACTASLQCMALEELLANKLKCLIQRRHSFDLYDFVYATFFERSIEVDRSLVLRTFLSKTIFEPSPGAAREILLGLPATFFKAAWEKYIVCPIASRFSFEDAWAGFTTSVDAIFGTRVTSGWGAGVFYPSTFRNLILEAGADRKLLRIVYDGRERLVEPYSLAYKRRRDGHAAEYFYAYDQTGGRTSGPGIKSFLHGSVQSLLPTDQTFEPRYAIELTKAGELPGKAYFARPSFGGGNRVTRSKVRRTSFGYRQTYKIECPYCQKRFTRSTPSTRLNKHNDANGYPCAGRTGYQV